MLRAEQRHELHVLRLVQPVDRRHACRIDARVIRDQPDALAIELLETVVRPAHRSPVARFPRAVGVRSRTSLSSGAVVDALHNRRARNRADAARQDCSLRRRRPDAAGSTRKITYRSSSGSIHIAVPVNPPWPNARSLIELAAVARVAGSLVPAEARACCCRLSRGAVISSTVAGAEHSARRRTRPFCSIICA